MCDNWQRNTSYYDRWSRLKIVKAFADDTLDGALISAKVLRLMSANQDHFLTFTNPGSSGLDAHFRPLPLKVCPSSSVMTGFKYHKSGDDAYIAGIDAIRCTYNGDASRSSWEPLFSSDGRHDQYVGRPLDTEKYQATCDPGEVIAGMEVHRATHNGRVTGFRPVCQSHYF